MLYSGRRLREESTPAPSAIKTWRIHYYVDWESIKTTMTNKCDYFTLIKFCCFRGGGGRGPVENPEIKWNKENVCECLASVRAGTGRRSGLTSEGKDFPKSPKQQQTQQLTAGHRRLLLCQDCLENPPRSSHLSSSSSSYPNLQKLAVGECTRIRYNFADMIVLECGKAEAYVNRHVGDVRYNSGQTASFLPIVAPWQPKNWNPFIYMMTRHMQGSYCAYTGKFHTWVTLSNDVWLCQHWKPQRTPSIWGRLPSTPRRYVQRYTNLSPPYKD